MSIEPIGVPEAIAEFLAGDDPEYAQDMIDLLQAGYVAAGRDEAGVLHVRVTEAGRRYAWYARGKP